MSLAPRLCLRGVWCDCPFLLLTTSLRPRAARCSALPVSSPARFPGCLPAACRLHSLLTRTINQPARSDSSKAPHRPTFPQRLCADRETSLIWNLQGFLAQDLHRSFPGSKSLNETSPREPLGASEQGPGGQSAPFLLFPLCSLPRFLPPASIPMSDDN